MSFDIYGGALERGHCEVHPHVAEPYPCGRCIDDQREQQQYPIGPECDICKNALAVTDVGDLVVCSAECHEEAERQQQHAAERNDMSKEIYNDGHRMVRHAPEAKPTKGGAHAFYEVVGAEQYADGKTPESSELVVLETISFQHDTIPAVGVVGVTNESVASIIIDRLEAFQAGEFACESNANALRYFKAGLEALELRTKDRKRRGVEGKHEA